MTQSLCAHGNSPKDCPVCDLEAKIDELPTLEEVQALDGNEKEALYATVSALADIYYDELTEEQQAQVSNIDALWEILDYFSSAIALASEDTGDFTVTGGTYGTDYTYKDHVLTISGSGSYTISMAVSGGSTSTDTIKVTSSSSVTITLVSVVISSSSTSPFEINASGSVTLILSGTNKFDASGAEKCAGLQKTSAANTLTITSAAGDGAATGSLTATGGKDGAGIGGGKGGSGSNITISGGTVSAAGGNEGAGIGGGWYKSGSNITISGGYITAIPGSGASAIGSGINGGNSSGITITGGYFADSSATTGISGTGKVYSCDVASGYSVCENTDAATLSAYPVFVENFFTGAVSISGEATYGSTVEVVIQKNTGNTFSYQWERDGEAISGATNSTYTLTAADIGKKITVRVTYTNGNDNGTVTSAAVTGGKAVPAVNLTDKTETYNGSAVAIDSATVTLVNNETYNGDIVYTYYIDAECTVMTGSNEDTSSGASTEGVAPVNAGTYYVKASVDAQGNYLSAESDAATVTINPKTVVLSWSTLNADELVYDGTEKTLSAEVANKAAESDVVSVTVDPIGDNKNVTEDGFYYTATGLTGKDSGNYQLSTDVVSATYTVGKAAVTITAADASKTYGDADPALTGTVTGVIDGDNLNVTYSRETGEGTGTYEIDAAYDTGNNNYSVTVEAAVFTIDKKAVTVTADNKTSVYGSDFEELTFTVSGESLVGSDTKEDLAVTLTKTSGTDVGVYAITGESASVNYDVTVTPGAYTITQASLMVTANDNTIIYGDAPANNGVSFSGFVDGESESDLGGTLVYSYSYIQYGNVGTYSITASGLSSDNYAIRYVDGELTVEQRTVELSWSTLSADALVYDGTAKTLSASVANKAQDSDKVSVDVVLAGDNVNVTVDGFYYTASGLIGTDSGNYRLPSYHVSDVCRITAASLSTGDFVVTQIDGGATVTLGADGDAFVNFTGSAIVPAVAVADGSLVASTPEDYTVSYGDNTAVGTGMVTITGQGNFTGELVYTFAIIDQVAPTGSLTIAENTWNTFWNTVTFGLFFNATQTVTVTASDGESGVAKTEYYLANAAVTDASELAEVTWTEFTDAFSIAPENSYVVYVKITDNSGNSAIINSDGIILETAAPAIEGLEDGKIYCADVTFTVSDDNLDYVLIDGEKAAGEALNQGSESAGNNESAAEGTIYSYTIAADNAAHTVQAVDKAGNETAVYTVTVNKGHTWVCTTDSVGGASGSTDISEAMITETCQYCKESASVKLSAPSGEQVYDGTSHDAVLSYSGILSGTSPSIIYTLDGQSVTDTTQAGEYTASITYGGKTVSVTYTVSRAAVTITAADVSKTCGDADPVLTGTVTGVIDGDDLKVTYSRADGEDAGTYEINGYMISATITTV